MQKITIGPALLRAVLNQLSPAINTNDLLPVRENVRIDAGNHQVLFTACKEGLTIQQTIQLQGVPTLTMLVPFEAVRKICAVTADDITISQHVEIKKDEKGNPFDVFIITISTGTSTFKVTTDNWEDYPKVPNLDKAQTLELPKEFMPILLNASASLATDYLRPAMCGYLLEAVDGNLRVVTTDGHTLFWQQLPVDNLPAALSLIISGTVTAAIKDFTGNPVTISYNKKVVCFECKGLKVIAGQVDANYPDYRAVIPEGKPTLFFDTTTAIDAIKRVTALAHSKIYSPCILNIEPNQIALTWQDTDFNRDSNGAFEIENKGCDTEQVGFNPGLLLRALKQAQAAGVDLACVYQRSSTHSMIITNAEETFLCLSMPVRLTA